ISKLTTTTSFPDAVLSSLAFTLTTASDFFAAPAGANGTVSTNAVKVTKLRSSAFCMGHLGVLERMGSWPCLIVGNCALHSIHRTVARPQGTVTFTTAGGRQMSGAESLHDCREIVN